MIAGALFSKSSAIRRNNAARLPAGQCRYSAKARADRAAASATSFAVAQKYAGSSFAPAAGLKANEGAPDGLTRRLPMMERPSSFTIQAGLFFPERFSRGLSIQQGVDCSKTFNEDGGGKVS